jgi:hypothetical protein
MASPSNSERLIYLSDKENKVRILKNVGFVYGQIMIIANRLEI